MLEYNQEITLVHELGHLIGLLRGCNYNLTIFKSVFRYISTKKNDRCCSWYITNDIQNQDEISFLGPATVLQINNNYYGIKTIDDIIELYKAGGSDDLTKIAKISLYDDATLHVQNILNKASLYDLTLTLNEKQFILDVLKRNIRCRYSYRHLEKLLNKHFNNAEIAQLIEH